MKTMLSIAFFLLVIGSVKAGPYDLDRIVSGEPAEVKPYHVHLSASRGETVASGGGVLITRRHVLTVASLVKGFDKWSIEYGSERFEDLEKIESFFGFVHPLYEQGKRNSFGVVILPYFLNKEYLEPIALPDVIEPLPRLYEEGTVVGFEIDPENERNARLKAAYLSVEKHEVCELESEEDFCAANIFYDANVCTTDIGSAFALHYRGGIVLGGLMTGVTGTCAIGDRSTYIRVQSYIEWLKVVTNA